MSLIEVADLGFGYTSDTLFAGLTFRLESGERASLVAPNGAGKSTLLRIVAGELKPDRGTVVLKKNASIGHCHQSHEFKAEGSLRGALLSGFADMLLLRTELADAQERAASAREADLLRLAELTDRYQHSGGDRLEHRIETIATRLGFRASDLERPVVSLSGGERGRLGLGVVLANEPDVLLLDEPTNHLDLDTIGWLEEHLASWRGALIVVSHDRAFLDAVCPITMELGKKNLRVYPLRYSDYHVEREADLERERKLAEQQAALVKNTEDFIRRNIAGQKTKQAQSRRKMLEKLERFERPEDVWAQAERLRFRFARALRSGDIALEAKNLFAERGGRILFQDLDLLIRRRDRLAIVGPNGAGKSTLLKLLAGRGEPADRGEVRRGSNLQDGYFDQHLGSLDLRNTGVDEIRSVRGDLNVDAARQYLARFRFYADDPLRAIHSLSGGERTRLALAKLLLEPRNLLFLDEPTNHLDIPAAEILEEALVNFDGTVLLASHDRRFLENVTTRTLHFDAAGVDLYEAGFADYGDLSKRRGLPEQSPAEQAPKVALAADGSGADRHKARRAAQRELERKRRRVSDLERFIAESEARIALLRQKLGEAPREDWENLYKWAKEDRELSQKVERMMAEWLILSDELGKSQAAEVDE